MSILDFFKKSENAPRTLKKEDIFVVGVTYYEENVKKLAVANPEWKKPNTKTGQKVFRYNFINKPVKLIPEPKNKHDKNAVQVIVAGELVGYIPASTAPHVKDIINKHEIKYITAYIHGGDYKVVSQNGDVFKDEANISINVRIAYV